MWRRIVVGIMSVVLAKSAWAGEVSFQAKTSYFFPTDDAFKSIYGNGPAYGGKIGFDFGNRLGIWLDAAYYSRTGQVTETQEETKLELIPITAGLRYIFGQFKGLSPYVGGGLGYFMYKEKNPIGSVSKGNFGFVIQAGLILKIGKTFFFDLQASYTRCRVKPAGVEAQLGGINAGLGLGLAL